MCRSTVKGSLNNPTESCSKNSRNLLRFQGVFEFLRHFLKAFTDFNSSPMSFPEQYRYRDVMLQPIILSTISKNFIWSITWVPRRHGPFSLWHGSCSGSLPCALGDLDGQKIDSMLQCHQFCERYWDIMWLGSVTCTGGKGLGWYLVACYDQILH